MTPFEVIDDAEALFGVTEARREEFVEDGLAGVTEGSVSEVVPEGNGLCQVLIEEEGAGDGTRDLSHLKCMGEAGPVVIASRREEDLGFSLESAEGLRMKDSVTVTLEEGAVGVFRFGLQASFRRGSQGGVRPQALSFALFNHFAYCGSRSHRFLTCHDGGVMGTLSRWGRL